MHAHGGRLAPRIATALLAALLALTPLTAYAAEGKQAPSNTKTFYTLVVTLPPCKKESLKPRAVLLELSGNKVAKVNAEAKYVKEVPGTGAIILNISVSTETEQAPKGIIVLTLECGKTPYQYVATPAWGGFTAAQPLWLTKAYASITAELNATSQQLSELGHNVSKLNESITESLRSVNAALDSLDGRLRSVNESLSKLIRELGSNITKISNNIDRVDEKVDMAVETLSDKLSEESKAINTSINKLGKRIEMLTNDLSKNITRLNNTIKAMCRGVVSKLSEIVSAQTSSVKSAVNTLNKSFAGLGLGVKHLQSNVTALSSRVSRSEALTIAVLGLATVNLVLLALLWKSVRCSVEELQ